MLTTGSLVSTATAARVAIGCAELWAKRTPPLMNLALSASLGNGGAERQAQAAFRDEMIGLARESAELSWREMRRGVDELDTATRPRSAPGDRPFRPHRVKL
jgi:hypothetical protein